MVYVVAAYSITVSVLLIYGVLLQHRARVARARLTEARSPGRGASRGGARGLESGFNLGAALLTPFWAAAHGRPLIGAALLAAFAALAAAQAGGVRLAVLLLAPLLLGASLFFGIVGNRIAATRSADRDPVAFAQSQLPWALAGAVLYTVVLPWVWHFWLGSR